MPTELTAAEHFKLSTAFVINLDRSEQRWDLFRETTGPLFADAHRVPAVDGLDATDDEIRAWIPRAFNTHKTLVPNAMRKHEAPHPFEKVKSRPLMWATASAGRAIYLSHIRAIGRGLSANMPRFFVCEDDVVPRDTFAAMSLPPADAEFTIWSGAIPRFNLAADTALFASGVPHRWQQIPRNSQHKLWLGAGCYELSRRAAYHLVAAALMWPGQWDIVWAQAMGRYPTYRITPELLVQSGASSRNKSVRTPKVHRDAPEVYKLRPNWL